jgi:hypothetical protein
MRPESMLISGEADAVNCTIRGSPPPAGLI